MAISQSNGIGYRIYTSEIITHKSTTIKLVRTFVKQMVEIRDKQNKISENAFTVVFLVTENSNVPINCHNPTNNLKQLKTIFVGVVLVLV